MQLTLDPDEELARMSIAYFDAHAREFAEREAPLHVDQTIYEVRQLMDADPLVLDLGCGVGRAIPPLQELGISRIIGIDASKGMLELARASYPGLDFRLGDVCDLKAVVDEECDGFFMSCVLMQIPRLSVGRALHSIRSVLRSGAIGFIGTPSGEGTHALDHCNSGGRIPLGHKVLLQRWHYEDLAPLLRLHGFKVIEPTFHQDCGGCGMLFITVTAV